MARTPRRFAYAHVSRTIPWLLHGAVGALAALAIAGPVAAASSIVDIGDFRAEAISGDGSVVAGRRSGATWQAFMWNGSLVPLGELSPGGGAQAFAVSRDGSVIVGDGASPGGGKEAFRWTAEGGMVGLGDLAGGTLSSTAYAVSADGSVVYGVGTTDNAYPSFRWTQASGLQLIDAGYNTTIRGTSAGGGVAVGTGTSANGKEAFRWTSGGGVEWLGDLLGGSFISVPYATSANGSVVVGYGTVASGREAFRWTSSTGMLSLGDFAGGLVASEALDVSADGSVVVGFGDDASNTQAMIWDEENGMRELAVVLESLGVDMTGWWLTRATGISDNGRIITGQGFHNNVLGSWIAYLPEPSTGTLLGLGLVLVAGWPTRRRARG